MLKGRMVRCLMLMVMLVSLTGGTALLLPVRLALTITDELGQLVHMQPAEPNASFVIRYMHSVHKTPVEEYFRVSEDRMMVLERVVFESYGVGNPSGLEEGEQFRMEGGKLIIANMERRMKEIVLRIGQVTANHTLVMHDRSIPFSSWSEPGSRVVLQVDQVPLWILLRQTGKGR